MTDFRNRIVEQRLVDAADLKSHPMNPRRHPEGQKRAVAGLLNEVGIVDSLTVYWSEAQDSYVVLDGHLRKDMGGMWPVNVLDVNDEEADLILATFDYTTSLAELDATALAELLARVEMTPVEDDGVRDLLAQLAGAAADGILAADAGGTGDERQSPDDFAEYGEDIETQYCCPKCGYQWSGKPE